MTPVRRLELNRWTISPFLPLVSSATLSRADVQRVGSTMSEATA